MGETERIPSPNNGDNDYGGITPIDRIRKTLQNEGSSSDGDKVIPNKHQIIEPPLTPTISTALSDQKLSMIGSNRALISEEKEEKDAYTDDDSETDSSSLEITGRRSSHRPQHEEDDEGKDQAESKEGSSASSASNNDRHPVYITATLTPVRQASYPAPALKPSSATRSSIMLDQISRQRRIVSERHSTFRKILQSDYELERAANKIHAELRQTELLELALEAERAADAGLERFSGTPTTFGDDLNLNNHSDFSTHQRFMPKRHSYTDGSFPAAVFSNGASSASSHKQLRVNALRTITEVIPSFEGLHKHMRTHLDRSQVTRGYLLFEELPPEQCLSTMANAELDDNDGEVDLHNNTSSKEDEAEESRNLFAQQSLEFLETMSDFSMLSLVRAKSACEPKDLDGIDEEDIQELSSQQEGQTAEENEADRFGPLLAGHMSPGSAFQRPKVQPLPGLSMTEQINAMMLTHNEKNLVKGEVCDNSSEESSVAVLNKKSLSSLSLSDTLKSTRKSESEETASTTPASIDEPATPQVKNKVLQQQQTPSYPDTPVLGEGMGNPTPSPLKDTVNVPPATPTIPPEDAFDQASNLSEPRLFATPAGLRDIKKPDMDLLSLETPDPSNSLFQPSSIIDSSPMQGMDMSPQSTGAIVPRSTRDAELFLAMPSIQTLSQRRELVDPLLSPPPISRGNFRLARKLGGPTPPRDFDEHLKFLEKEAKENTTKSQETEVLPQSGQTSNLSKAMMTTDSSYMKKTFNRAPTPVAGYEPEASIQPPEVDASFTSKPGLDLSHLYDDQGDPGEKKSEEDSNYLFEDGLPVLSMTTKSLLASTSGDSSAEPEAPCGDCGDYGLGTVAANEDDDISEKPVASYDSAAAASSKEVDPLRQAMSWPAVKLPGRIKTAITDPNADDDDYPVPDSVCSLSPTKSSNSHALTRSRSGFSQAMQGMMSHFSKGRRRPASTSHSTLFVPESENVEFLNNYFYCSKPDSEAPDGGIVPTQEVDSSACVDSCDRRTLSENLCGGLEFMLVDKKHHQSEYAAALRNRALSLSADDEGVESEQNSSWLGSMFDVSSARDGLNGLFGAEEPRTEHPPFPTPLKPPRLKRTMTYVNVTEKRPERPIPIGHRSSSLPELSTEPSVLFQS